MVMDWMMLDRFVYRRDDDADGGFPDESVAPLRATSSTSLGQAFDVAFLPGQPPAISRLYVRWPGGTTPEDGNGTDIAAAHRDLLLLRLTSIQDIDESPYRRSIQDHFICVASSDPDGPRLRLKRLPVCTIPMVVVSPFPPYCREDDNDRITTSQEQQRVFIPNTVGLTRAPKSEEEEEEEEFAVAQLAKISKIPGTRGMMQAEVCVLRSRVSSSHDDDDDGTWEVKQIPIQHKSYEFDELFFWSINLAFNFYPADPVITFNNSICWVNYYLGGILFYEVFGEERPPKISYLCLPTSNRPFANRQPGFVEANRALCVTAGIETDTGGDVLKYITTIRTDGQLYGPIPTDEAFYILVDTLWTKADELRWIQDMCVTSCSLWAHNAASVPQLQNNSLMFPLVSMDDHTIAHFMLSEESHEKRDRRKVSVVTIDLVTETVNSVIPYINGDEDLLGEDADMLKEKSHLLKPFLPSEFPKFFNLTR